MKPQLRLELLSGHRLTREFGEEAEFHGAQ